MENQRGGANDGRRFSVIRRNAIIVQAAILAAWTMPLLAQTNGSAQSDKVIFVPNGVVGYAVESIADAKAFGVAHPELVATHQSLPPRRLPGFDRDKAIANAQSLMKRQAGNTQQPGSRVNRAVGSGTRGSTFISFQGPDVCNCEPPDPILAVGPFHVLMGINDQLRAADKANGTTVWSVDWETFFASVNPAGAGGFTSDPKLLFDPTAHRYFATILSVKADLSKAWWMLAASTSDNIADATTLWRKWSFDPTIVHPTSVADYPGFGFDNNAIYITSNMFDSHLTYLGVDMAVIPKAQLLVDTPTPTFNQVLNITTAAGGLAFTVQPASMYNSTANGLLVSASATSGGSIFVYQVNGALSVPTLRKAAVTVQAYSFPPDADQLGTDTLVATGDSRMLSAVWRNNSLWAAHAVSKDGFSGARWYQIDTTAFPTVSLTQSGTYIDENAHYYYPSIAVDPAGNMALGFTRSSTTEFACAWHTSRQAADPPGTLANPQLDHAGNAPYEGVRWGDFSGTVLDPVDNITFWTLQEYAESASDIGWSTWCSSFQSCAGPAAPTGATAIPNSACAGDPVTLTAFADVGAPLQWYVGGCGVGDAIGAGTSINIVAPASNTTYFVRSEEACRSSPCVNVTLNIISAGIVPSSPTATPNPACPGQMVTLSASGGTGTLTWYAGGCASGSSIGTGTSVDITAPSSNASYFVRAESSCGQSTCVSLDLNIAGSDLCASQGACCIDNKTCHVDVNHLACDGLGGVWQGDGSFACTDCPPPPPSGACCIRGACSMVPQLICSGRNGTWHGTSTSCDSSPCGPPNPNNGACCMSDDTCAFVSSARCAELGGTITVGKSCKESGCGGVGAPDLNTITDACGTCGAGATSMLACALPLLLCVRQFRKHRKD